MKPTTSAEGCPGGACRAGSTKKDIHGAQLRRRRFDDQALKDILKAMRLAERVLEDTQERKSAFFQKGKAEKEKDLTAN